MGEARRKLGLAAAALLLAAADGDPSAPVEAGPAREEAGAAAEAPAPEAGAAREADSAARETPGVGADEILFGQSCALSGPAKALGQGMRLGIEAAFEEANRGEGVHGRRLRLKTLDDAYEPEQAIENTRELIDSEGVFALIGPVGTPTSKAAEPIATAAGVPYVAAFTGAEFLRNARARPTVVNVRASYFQETEAIVQRLTEDLGVERIGILYQDDSYGRAGFAGTFRALDRRGMRLVAVSTYVRNTTAVKTAVLDLQVGRPQAIVIVGAYRPVAEFIRWSRYLGFDPIFVNISFVGSAALAKELGSEGKDVLISQVVPFPYANEPPVVARYREALRDLGDPFDPGFVSLEGYLAGLATVEALRRAGPEPTREGFLEGFRSSAKIDLGGFELSYGKRDNQGSDRVYLTALDGEGGFRSIQRLGRR